MHPHLARNPATLAALFGAYFLLGQAGLAIGGSVGAAGAVWPPAGLAVVAVLLLGPSVWPAIFAGAFLAHAVATGQTMTALAIGVGNTLEAVIAASLIERLANGAAAFKRANTVVRFVAIAAFAGAPVSATCAALAHALTGSMGLLDFSYVWMTWWLAHLTGLIVVTPFLALWATTPLKRVRVPEVIEGVVLIGALVGVGLVVFGGRFPSDVQNYPLEFLCVPFLLWSAFRFGRRETATTILVLSTLAVWGTLRGFGPFVRDSPNEALVLVQAYTSVMAITGLILASALAEHKRAEAQLLELATTDSLTGLVNYRRLLEVLRAEIARSNRTSRPFAVLFIDMDGLKRINDRYGHLVGSRALSRLGEILRATVRTTDTPSRFGGDEFAIVLPETGEEGGRIVLGRLAERVAADVAKPAISISGGVAVFPRDGDTPTLLLRAADKALYDAKSRAAARRRVLAQFEERKTGTTS